MFYRKKHEMHTDIAYEWRTRCTTTTVLSYACKEFWWAIENTELKCRAILLYNNTELLQMSQYRTAFVEQKLVSGRVCQCALRTWHQIFHEAAVHEYLDLVIVRKVGAFGTAEHFQEFNSFQNLNNEKRLLVIGLFTSFR